MPVQPTAAETERRRVAMCEWLTANGINPNHVPADSAFRIATGRSGQRTIHYTGYVTTADGNKQVDPEDRNRAWREERTAPCQVEPAAWLRIEEANA